MKPIPIPISAAKLIAEAYGYDQIVIMGRKVGEPPNCGEHVTTYGVTKQHCKVAAYIGDFIKYKIMMWNDGDNAAV
jgi:hypothetical protein